MVNALLLCLKYIFVISVVAAAPMKNNRDFHESELKNTRTRQPTEAEMQQHKKLSKELAVLRKRLTHIGVIAKNTHQTDNPLKDKGKIQMQCYVMISTI